MTEKRYDKDNPRFRDEFGCVNDLQTGESYLCGESGFIGERDALETAIALCEVLNKFYEENEQLKQQLQEIQNSFEFNWTQNYEEVNKDKLYIKDTNTKLCLDGTNLFIEVYIPQIKEYYRFKYIVTGRRLMREFIENYNSKGDVE